MLILLLEYACFFTHRHRFVWSIIAEPAMVVYMCRVDPDKSTEYIYSAFEYEELR